MIFFSVLAHIVSLYKAKMALFFWVTKYKFSNNIQY